MVVFASLMTGEIIECANGVISIGYEAQYSFNKIRLEKEENKKVVEDVASEVLKEKVRIKYIVDQKEENIKSPEEMLKSTFGEELVEIIDE